MSQLLETNADFETQKQIEQHLLDETSFLSGFQLRHNCAFDSNNTLLAHRKRNKTPYYRRINKYSKSIQQYKKERNRRKQAYKLACKGYTHEQIAEKLGVSTKTVQRDFKKLKSYINGKLNKTVMKFEEERWNKIQAQLKGLNEFKRLHQLTNLLIKLEKQRRGREYSRHLMKIIIDMDDLVEDTTIPKIKRWPNREHMTFKMPLHFKFYYRIGGKNLRIGGFDLT